jgi:hypothetical protein
LHWGQGTIVGAESLSCERLLSLLDFEVLFFGTAIENPFYY